MKVGIITMHKVQNIGSALQTYALQYKIESLGYDAETIDYMNIPEEPKPSFQHRVLSFFFDLFSGFPSQKMEQRFSVFYERFYKCSEKQYSRNNIDSNPPFYDVYCTGSDQVWNPGYIKDDINYMLNFAPDGMRRISYASSFATNLIPLQYKNIYSKALAKYDFITVREASGVKIVRELTDITPNVVCDPTLLLSASEWNKIADTSTFNVKGRYILVYLLGYMYDPRPGIFNIIKSVQKGMGLPVIYVNGGYQEMLQPKSRVFRGLGPVEFLSLVKNASFIVTDSFHGTAFATLYNLPMLGVVKDRNTSDGRLTTLRNTVGGEKSIIGCNEELDFDPNNIDAYRCDSTLLKEYVNHSESMLNQMLRGV